MASPSDLDEQLQRAISLATEAHAGQVDKGGAPYIEHPLRVMRSLSDLEAQIVGVLHDTVEDTDLTPARLRQEGFQEPVVQAVDALTKRLGEDYEAYLVRLMSNRLAVQVKIADMQDNMDLSRIPRPTEKDRARLQKYERVLPRLQEILRLLGAAGGNVDD